MVIFRRDSKHTPPKGVSWLWSRRAISSMWHTRLSVARGLSRGGQSLSPTLPR